MHFSNFIEIFCVPNSLFHLSYLSFLPGRKIKAFFVYVKRTDLNKQSA